MYYAHSREDGQYEPLEHHLQETAALAETFAGAFGAERWGRMVGLFHDIGKASPGFQSRLMKGHPRVDHSTAGAKRIRDHCGKIGAYCVAGHHGALPDGGDPTDTGMHPTLHGRLKREQPSIERCDASVLGQVDKAPMSLPFVINGSDGIGAAMFIRMLTSCLVDADRLSTEQFVQGDTPRGGHDDLKTLYTRLLARLDKFGPPQTPINEKRAAIQADCLARAQDKPGLFTLTVPTGGGKTLASLAFALRHAIEHGMERVIYVIPYVSIIEQNADVFRKAVGDDNVLEHHANFAFDDETVRDVRLRLAMENWDAPLVVTTSVRFFESLFAAKTSQLRKLHNIARSVILLDEAQMMPQPYLKPCVAALSELIRHYGCSAVLMTATQPALNEFFPPDIPMREIMKNPIDLYTFFRRTTIKSLGGITIEALAEWMNGHAQALCIVNTRKTAQQLTAMLPEDGTYHLSTLMHPNHRRRVLAEIREQLAAGKSCRVVATSLIEAGVDVDFPVVYRQEAGLDSVIQAAGRCNREGKWAAEDSHVHIFQLEGDGVSRMPASIQQAASATRQVFEAYDDPASLQAIERYFRLLYYVKGNALDREEIIRLTSQDMGLLSIPFRQIEEKFQLIDNNTVPVIIATDPEAAPLVARMRGGEVSRGLMRALGAYTVNVYEGHVKALYEVGAVERIDAYNYLLAEEKQYNERTGLALDVEYGLGNFI